MILTPCLYAPITGLDIDAMTEEQLNEAIDYDVAKEAGPVGTIIEWLPLLAEAVAEMLYQAFLPRHSPLSALPFPPFDHI